MYRLAVYRARRLVKTRDKKLATTALRKVQRASLLSGRVAREEQYRRVFGIAWKSAN